MQVANYVRKYARTNSSRAIIKKDRINSTHKWVEYSLDVADMQHLLMLTKNINEKFALLDALDVAERKKVWHFRQENFCLKTATYLLQVALKIPKK
jgi:hypothetical protein